MTPTLAVVIVSVAVVALAAIGASVWGQLRYGAARDARDQIAKDLAREQLDHERDRRALADAKATAATLADTVRAREAALAVSEAQVRRLQLAASPSDRADAMGAG